MPVVFIEAPPGIRPEGKKLSRFSSHSSGREWTCSR